MISNRCARKSLVTNCNSIISKNYLRLLVDSNDILYRTSVCKGTNRIDIFRNFAFKIIFKQNDIRGTFRDNCKGSRSAIAS